MKTVGTRGRSSTRSELGRREPLQMQDVRPTEQQRGDAGQVLGRLERDAQARAPEQPRREGIEGLAAAVADRRRCVAESEP